MSSLDYFSWHTYSTSPFIVDGLFMVDHVQDDNIRWTDAGLWPAAESIKSLAKDHKVFDCLITSLVIYSNSLLAAKLYCLQPILTVAAVVCMRLGFII